MSRTESETASAVGGGLGRPVATVVKDWGQGHSVLVPVSQEFINTLPAGTPLYASPAQPPAGYRVVPVEPTEAMLAEGALATRECVNAGMPEQPELSCYRAMVAAAPQVGPPKEER